MKELHGGLSNLDGSPNLVLKNEMQQADAQRKGRPRKGYDEQQLTEVLRLYFLEKLSMRKVADVVGLSHMSVYRMLSDPNVELLV
ncbi:helix-turn-helix domain-containing protein [Candidatus Micrarchaeota archaeon]|nr:helix-turn-helix domain-containing protein [Candidatus Micrarchaeota archaeon]